MSKKYTKRSISELNKLRLKYVSGFLHEYRLNMGFTRNELSRQTGIQRSVIENIENPNRNNNIISLFELLEFYDLSPEELFLELS